MNLERDLTAAGPEDRPGDADDVAGVEIGEPVELFLAQLVAIRHELYAAFAVLQVRKDHAALEALDHQPAGDRDGLGPLEVPEKRLCSLARLGWPEPSRIWIDARRAQSLELLAPITHHRRQVGLYVFRHDPKD
jgi:hypothetical protein